MPKRYKNSLRNKVLEKIMSMKTKAILFSDLKELSGPRQISRALNDLINDGLIVRISRGVYARTKRSQYSDQPIMQDDFTSVCIDALDRLGINWEVGQLIKDYNEGKSQQVPAFFIVRLKSRFRRHFKFGRSKIIFEGGINAK